MQIDGYFTYLWQLDSIATDGIVLELRKHKGLELTALFEAREPVPSFLKSLLSIVQSANRSLQYLGMDLTQMREFLLQLSSHSSN